MKLYLEWLFPKVRQRRRMPGRIRRALLILGALLGWSAGYSQFNFSDPEKLPPEINSPAEESFPLLTEDGKGLFFVRSFYDQNTGGKEAGQDIWFSARREDNSWTIPANDFPLFNNSDNNAVIGINTFTNAIYMMNAYHEAEEKHVRLEVAMKSGESWSPPRTLIIKGIEPKGRFTGFYMHPDEDILMISMAGKDSQGMEDLYACIRDSWGRWSRPLNLGPAINTAGYEISPFLTADKKGLFFSSNGRPDSQSADIYFSERLDNSWQNWSEPVRLPEGVNSEHFDAYFSLYQDEAFFVSARDSSFTDIYTARLLPEALLADNEPDGNEPALNEALEPASGEWAQSGELFTSKGSAYIYFDFASFTLDEAMKSMLAYIAGNLSAKKYELELIGYADDLGSANYNRQLSQNRADAVKAFLVSQGLDPDKIYTLGKGEIPLPETHLGEEQRKRNRRVELVVID